MKIAVIGANGRTGQVFVRAALRAGHQVQAGIHNSSDIKAVPGLSFTECDATQESKATKLILGVNNLSSFNVDATCNWWGAANGPGPVGPGSGDKVTTGVTFISWLKSTNLNGKCGDKDHHDNDGGNDEHGDHEGNQNHNENDGNHDKNNKEQ
jgi:hypothetical protein